MDDWRELKLMVKALGSVARLTIVYLLAREDDVTVTALTDMLGLSNHWFRGTCANCAVRA